jgi:translation initiation factor IF-2
VGHGPGACGPPLAVARRQPAPRVPRAHPPGPACRGLACGARASGQRQQQDRRGGGGAAGHRVDRGSPGAAAAAVGRWRGKGGGGTSWDRLAASCRGAASPIKPPAWRDGTRGGASQLLAAPVGPVPRLTRDPGARDGEGRPISELFRGPPGAAGPGEGGGGGGTPPPSAEPASARPAAPAARAARGAGGPRGAAGPPVRMRIFVTPPPCTGSIGGVKEGPARGGQSKSTRSLKVHSFGPPHTRVGPCSRKSCGRGQRRGGNAPGCGPNC